MIYVLLRICVQSFLHLSCYLFKIVATVIVVKTALLVNWLPWKYLTLLVNWLTWTFSGVHIQIPVFRFYFGTIAH